MEENKDCVADRSHVPGSHQEDPSSALLQSSKLRNKLGKLARWRIDPSSIEFPQDAHEFRGGFAMVSQGLLTSSSHGGGGANEHPSPEVSKPQSETENPEPGEDHQSKGEEGDSRAVDGDNDGKQEPQTRNPTSIGDRSASSEYTVDDSPDVGDRNAQPRSDTHQPDGDQGGKDKEPNSRGADGDNDKTQEEGMKRSDNTKEERNSDDQTSKQKMIAVKKLKIERDTEIERVLGLMLKELEFLVELSHPNIVKPEGFVEDVSAQKVWLIFPWEEHGNLRDFLASGEWEIPERISLIEDVTLGLEYLHGLEPPVYHGDLKSVGYDLATTSNPPVMVAKEGPLQLNILVSSECYALITDFGSAHHLERDRTSKQPKGDDHQPRTATDLTTGQEHITLEALFSATASTITLTGSSYTLRWAAPELLQDDKPCLRSDIWALGWIAYEVMTNTIPFQDIKKDAIVINRVIQGHLPSVTEHARMSLIRALCSLMVQCWSINPDGRPTAEECRKSISWMPKIVPASRRSMDEEASQLRGAQLLNQLGHMYSQQADYLSALSCFTEALNIYTTNNDSWGRAEALRGLADVHRFRSQHAEAVPFYSEALKISTDLGDETGRASSIFGLAEAHQFRREHGEAAKLYSECLQIYTNIGDKRARAAGLWGLAVVHREQGEYSEAINLYSEALQINTDVGDRREGALNLLGLAEVHRFQNKYSKAINLYSEALQILTDVGDHTETAIALWGLAQVHRFQQEYSKAQKLYSESLQVYTDIGHTQGRGIALWGLAKVHQALHEYDEATQLYSEAMQICTDVGDKYWRAETLMGLAETSEKRGHSGEAISLYTEASEAWEDIGYSGNASKALESAADIRKALQEATTDSAETLKVGEDLLLPSE